MDALTTIIEDVILHIRTLTVTFFEQLTQESLLALRGEGLGVKLMMEHFFSTNNFIDMTAINTWPV